MVYNIKKTGLLLVILLITLVFVQAQNSSRSIGEFKYSGQSKIGIFKSGESASFKINAFGGFEYNIHIKAEDKLEGVFFRIKKPNNEILYDSKQEGVLDKQFIMENSQMLLIEVVVPESKSGTVEKGGIGVTLEYRKVG